MAAILKIRKEHIESEIHFDFNGASRKVVLKIASQEELAMVKELGYFDHLFEKAEKEK